MNLVLIPAIESDKDFVNTLTRSTMRPYVEATWADEAQREHYYYINRFRQLGTSIIIYNNERVGRLTQGEKDTHTWVLEELHVLSTYQSQGIGSQLIKELLAQAYLQKKNVYLIVLKTNPAKQLYERLGFKVIEESVERYYMQTQELFN